MGTAFEHCGDINPSNEERCAINTYTNFFDILHDLRGSFEKVRMKYSQSGNQDAEDPQSEWWNFCQGDVLTMYGFAVMGGCNKSVINLMAKTLDDAGMDTGVKGEKKSSKKTSTAIRKRGFDVTPDTNYGDINGSDQKKIVIQHQHQVKRSDDDKEIVTIKLAMEGNMMILGNPHFDDVNMKSLAKQNMAALLERLNRDALGPNVARMSQFEDF